MTSTLTDPKRIYQSLISTADISCNNLVPGFRNKIINGAMRIDQRNVGASVSLNAASTYVTDRFLCNNALSIATTFQQGILGNSGFPARIVQVANTHCLTWVNNSTASTSTAAVISVSTQIEGNNLVDLLWGFIGPKTVTLSFWVYASVVGTYSVSLQNNGLLTNYISTYTITNANSWQKMTIVISGPVIGVWTTDTTCGINLTFTLHGSTSSVASSVLNTWQTTSTQFFVASTQTNLALTASSTFSITGIQLEVGAIPTPFEWRTFEQETRLCQRYYEKSCAYNFPLLIADSNGCYSAIAVGATYASPGGRFAVEKRIAPTVRVWNPSASAPAFGNANLLLNSQSYAAALQYINPKGWLILTSTNNGFGNGSIYQYHFDANAEF